MTKADSVHSTPQITASKTNPPDQAPMTTDDEIGMAWWNALTKQERAKWSAIAGNTGRPKDAWEAFKRGSMDQSPPVDPTRRRFLAVAAVASVVSAGTLAAAAAMDPGVPHAVVGIPTSADPIFAAIEKHQAAATFGTTRSPPIPASSIVT
jgi:ABC-type sugar transport system substrate-binding protein